MDRPTVNTVLAVTAMILPFLVWLVQRRMNAKETKRLKVETDLATERADVAEERRSIIARGHQIVLDRLAALETQNTSDSVVLATLREQMLPIAEAMKRKLVEALMHPGPEFAVADALLEAVLPFGASLPPELVPILAEREVLDSPHVTEIERLAASALPIIVRLAELEAGGDSGATVTDVQLVSSTVKSTETKESEEQ